MMKYTTPEWEMIKFNLTDVLETSPAATIDEEDAWVSDDVPLGL